MNNDMNLNSSKRQLMFNGNRNGLNRPYGNSSRTGSNTPFGMTPSLFGGNNNSNNLNWSNP